jgi:hypothetical protein
MIPKRQLLETTSQLGLARVEASIQQPGGTADPRFELFAESFRGSPAGVVALEWFEELMQMTRSSTKRESWRLVYSLRKCLVPKQQEGVLAVAILDGIAPMLNVTFSTRTFALLLTLLEAMAVWNHSSWNSKA